MESVAYRLHMYMINLTNAMRPFQEQVPHLTAHIKDVDKDIVTCINSQHPRGYIVQANVVPDVFALMIRRVYTAFHTLRLRRSVP